MKVWLIQPHDPLIFRDARPFSATPGAIARSLPFPFPSTIAGGVRSQAGTDGDGYFFVPDPTILKKLEVRGPLLVVLNGGDQQKKGDDQQVDGDDQQIKEWLLPAPADALLISAISVKDSEKKVEDEKHTNSQDGLTILQLEPLKPIEGSVSDLSFVSDLWLVGLTEPRLDKPAKDAPAYWRWSQFEQWLIDPTCFTTQTIQAETLGLMGPRSEERIHVAMDTTTRKGRDGFLFATSGIEFTSLPKRVEPRPALAEAQQLALAVMVCEETLPPPGPGEQQPQLRAGLGCLGSERRMVTWREAKSSVFTCPTQVKENIRKTRTCRLILLTPAYFAQGYLPTWLLTDKRNGVTVQLKAIANHRPQVVSGWNMEKPGPKASRRLAPAGSVLFLQLTAADDTDIEQWIDQTWLHCVSDNDADGDENQSRLDGMGLAVLGTWLKDAQESMQKEMIFS